MDEAKIYQRQVSRQKAVEALEALKKAGMQANELSPQEIARIKEKAKPVIDKYANDVGEALYAEVTAEIAKKRGTN
jgi:TRAP-type C4-dicarboxylate transport system substrate-binding protein